MTLHCYSRSLISRLQRVALPAVLIVGLALGAASASATDLSDRQTQRLVDTGVRLELSRQWRDAIDHYSEALRERPSSKHLQYGLRRSKIHFSIDRRYADESFTQELNRLTVDEALQLYDDVLLRIRDYFVEPISVTSLVAHGTESLWLALANEKFLNENAFGADETAVRRLRDRLHRGYWNREVPSESAARDAVVAIASIARDEVGMQAQPIILEYIFGACNCLDDYSHVLTPGRVDDLYSSIHGEFVGIGIVMEAEPGRGMVLRNVLPDSPAATGGLRPSDYLTVIDGQDVRTMSTDEAANLLSGVSGSQVTLTVVSRDGDSRTVTCTRRRVEVRSVPIVEMIDRDAGIGYIRLTGFQKSTPYEMDAALKKLQDQGLRKLIWDVRGNPGGLLDAAVQVLDRFIDNGVLLITRGRVSDANATYSSTRPATFRGELVLLIDGHSASASEIVAGAIRDHARGTIVGRKSFGKWSVQSIYPTLFESGLKLTTAKFFSPDGNAYARSHSYDTLGGLTPDVTVEQDDENPIIPGFDRVDGNDPDVLKAAAILSGSEIVRQ